MEPVLQNRRDTVVGGKTYSIILPPVTQCVLLANRTAVLLSPVLAGGMGASTKGFGATGSLAEKIRAIMGPALVALTTAFTKVDPVQSHQLMMDAVYASHLCCENNPVSTPIDFDKHFETNRGHVYAVLTWTLWECVRDFFPSQEGSPLQAIMKTAKVAFQSLKGGAQTGGSEDPAGKDSVATES